MTDFGDLIDMEGLTPDEAARLQRVHELLLEAGPPAELPPGLDRVGPQPAADLVRFPKPRRRPAPILLAAAIAVAIFGGGYLFGHANAQPASVPTERVVTMRPTGSDPTNALAVLKVAPADSAGNWPIVLTVQGLPGQAQRDAYYELWLTKDGKPAEPCVAFRVHANATTVEFDMPYSLHPDNGWAVTAHRPGQPEPGHIMLTT